MRFCEHCGIRQEDGWIACPYCGTAAEEMQEGASAARAAVEQKPAKAAKPKKRFAWWKLLIIIEVIAAVALAVYVGYAAVTQWGWFGSSQAASNDDADKAPSFVGDDTYDDLLQDDLLGSDDPIFDEDMFGATDVAEIEYNTEDGISHPEMIGITGTFDDGEYTNLSLDLRCKLLDMFPLDAETANSYNEDGWWCCLCAGWSEENGQFLLLMEETSLTTEEALLEYAAMIESVYADEATKLTTSAVTDIKLADREFLQCTVNVDDEVYEYCAVSVDDGYSLIINFMVWDETTIEEALSRITTLMSFEFDTGDVATFSDELLQTV